MYEYIIKQYIKNLSEKDIQDYAQKQGINVSFHDAKILKETAKKDWYTFYKGDPTTILETLKAKIDPITYEAGLLLYENWKKNGSI